MDTRPSLDLPSEALRARVAEVVRRHWVRPQPAEPFALPAEQSIEDLARSILDTMLTRQFRVGPLPSADLYEQFLAPIRRFVRKGKPVRVTVGYGPLKNPNGVAHSRAD